MKNIKLNFITKGMALGFSFMMMVGCNDFLEVTPPSDLSPDTYLWDESHLAAYTIKYYADYDNYSNSSRDKSGMLPSHYGSGGESFYNDDTDTDNVVTGTNNRFVPGEWRVGERDGDWYFGNIYALNYYLQTVVPRYEEGTLTGDQTRVKHYIGEGYFLRAHEYFYRLRRLGDFPIVTTTLPDDQQALTEASQRKPRNEVARFILKDLDAALGLLNNTPTGGKQRITRNAALLLKARVALFEATWEKYHAGTAQVPNGEGWPGASKSYNSGYQFPSGSAENEVNFFLTEAMNAASEIAENIDLAENNKIIRESTADPKNPYYDMFASLDPEGYDEVLMYREHIEGLNTHSYNHYLYLGGHRGYTHQMEQTFLMQNGLPVYATGSGYAGDDYIEDTKANRDWRWRLFMKAPGETKTVEGNITTHEKFLDAPRVYSSDGKNSTTTGYLVGKGFSLNYDMQMLGKDCTSPVIFRAGEAYLIYLEASYLLNGNIDQKADKYWKAIRTRAGVDTDYSKTIAATDMSKEALNDWGAYSKGQLVDATLYNIRRERRCELLSEGQRYNDLLRWRSMDQLNGFQIEGMKVWGPMKDRYVVDGESLLIADQADETKNNMSSPSLSDYIRPFQVVKSNNKFYNGYSFTAAHYLEPIAIRHFLITAPDGKTISESPIYQNPGWPTEAGAGAITN